MKNWKTEIKIVLVSFCCAWVTMVALAAIGAIKDLEHIPWTLLLVLTAIYSLLYIIGSDKKDNDKPQS